MKLCLSPKGGQPDLFELGPSEIRVRSQVKPRFESRSSYRSLSATYHVRAERRVRKADLIVKLVAFSILPAVFIYFSLDLGWLLVVLAVMLAAPLFFIIRSAMRKPLSRITFIEHADGDFAFYIPYYADEEAVALNLAREIQKRIESEKTA
jgi:hypothetical protein